MVRPFRNPKSIILFSALAILAIQIAIGAYAIYLGKLFYATYGPFYDSLAYFNQLADMNARAQFDGRVSALLEQARHSTVFYPWLAFTPFAGVIQLDRGIATFIQILASTVMQYAVFAYFLREHRNWKVALASSSLFMGIAALFSFNGGISDFRMDLIQYFFYTVVMALYLIARCAKTYVFLCWMLFGVGVGILCLARATSPVYLILLAAVFAPADLLSATGRRRELLVGWGIAGATAAIVAGWFYLANWKYLHHYYFVWNADANARLPITQSAKHISFTLGHIGNWLCGALLLRAAITVFAGMQQFGRQVLLRVNWRPLWFSIVPVGYLVLTGAGLNPFVSIVGAAGLLMFLLQPLVPVPQPIGPRGEWFLAAAIFAAVSINAMAAVGNHSREDRVSSWIPRREGLEKLIRAMTDHINVDRPRRYGYAVAHIGSLSADVIFNTLAYDRRLPIRPKATVVYGNATLAKCYQGVGTWVEWSAIAGATDDERIGRVVDLLNSQCDFLAMADMTSQLPPSVYINQFIPEIYRRILLSGWQPITEPLVISPTERIILLRNRGRSEDGVSIR